MGGHSGGAEKRKDAVSSVTCGPGPTLNSEVWLLSGCVGLGRVVRGWVGWYGVGVGLGGTGCLRGTNGVPANGTLADRVAELYRRCRLAG